MDGEKISVIVPVYRVELYLRKCIDSIVNQTYRNLEIILVDDGSPDNCGAICDEYVMRDSRIKVIHQANSGVSAARNAGLNISTGEWIAWVDADDWIENDMFQYLLEGVADYQADVVVCGMRKIGVHKPLIFHYKREEVLDQEQAIRELLENKNMTLSCCDKMARRKLWEGLHFSDLKIGEDLLTVGRLFDRADTVVCLPAIKYNYRTRPESALTNGSLESRLDCWRAAIQQYKELETKWPRLRPALAGRSVAAAIGVWSAYLSAAEDRRRELMPEIKEIAAFCRDHRQDALNHIELGPTGRVALIVTPYPTWWAFLAARIASWFYQVKHKRPL